MKNEELKNIVLLKDLPSNIIEEAIIVLKENKKIHKYQKIIERQNKIKNSDGHNNQNEIEENIDKKLNKKTNKKINKDENKSDSKNNIKNKVVNENDYIIKEAYMLLEDYTKKLERETPKWKNNLKKLEKKYKNSVKLNIILASIITLGVIFICIKLI